MKTLLEHKPSSLIAEPIVTEAVVRLTDNEFNTFCAAPLRDYDFIEKHIEKMYQDKEAAHCIAVISQTGDDAVYIESEGYSYARRAAYATGGKLGVIVTPALKQQIEACECAVDFIAARGCENPEDGKLTTGYRELYQAFGLNLGFDLALVKHIRDRLELRDEVLHVEDTGEAFAVVYNMDVCHTIHDESVNQQTL